MTFLATKYRVTTFYYFRTNRIIKNFNGLLENVFTKIFRALKSDSAPPRGSAWEPATQSQRRDVCASRAWSVGVAVVGEGVEKALG
jgi:hypothetical protein